MCVARARQAIAFAILLPCALIVLENWDMLFASLSPAAPNISHTDLSLMHSPLRAPQGVQLPREALRLSSAALERWHRDGYVSNVQLLTANEAANLAAELDEILTHHLNDTRFHEIHENESGDPEAVLAHGLGHWRIGVLAHDLVFHPRIAAIASQLLGTKSVRLFHDQFFVKPPGKAGPVAWHQDYSYWTRTRPMNHLTFHIALDDCTEDAIGGLQFVPGSHRWRDAPLPITSLHFKDEMSILSVLEPAEQAAFTPMAAALRVGEMSVHHALSVHGSKPNLSGRPRRALVVNVFGDGTYFDDRDSGRDTGGLVLEGVPRFEIGARLEGQFFPLLTS